MSHDFQGINEEWSKVNVSSYELDLNTKSTMQMSDIQIL